MKKRLISKNEAIITELLASTGFIFPRNIIELNRFETLHGEVDYGLTGREIDPNVILGKKQRESKSIKLSDVHNFLNDSQRLVAKKEEDSHNPNIDEIINKSRKKRSND